MGARRTALALALGASVLAGRPARAQPVPAPVVRALAPHGGMPVRWPRAPLLLRARERVGAERAWERPEVGARGRGAVVCVVDSGLDLSHPSFRDADGRTRVLSLLDVEGAPRGTRPDLERGGGAVWTAEEIDAALVGGDPLPTDGHGHGTAIVSAAAGDGAGLGAPGPGASAGMAPEAGILVVDALREGSLGFEDADVVRGVDFCFAASPDATRTVVVLALGGHDGAHDGSEPLEVALARHAARGRLLVVAAGNDGGRSVHAAGRATSSPAQLEIVVPPPEDVAAPHEVALVVAGAPSLLVARPDGSVVGPVPAGERRERADGSGWVLVDGSARAGVHYVALGGGGAHAALRGGRFRLEVGGPARFDAWMLDAEVEPGAALGASFGADRLVPLEEVAIPATHPDLVAIGASVTREVFASDRGTPALVLAADAEGRALFSSRGPSRGGWPRPDVLAPGALVTVALSSALDGDRTRTLFGSDAALEARRDGEDVVLAGSSISAAIAAGALALALSSGEPPPSLSRLRAALVRSARGALAWTAGAGAGELDVQALLEASSEGESATGADPGRTRLAATRDVIVPGATDVVVVAHVTGADARPVHGGQVVVERAGGGELGAGPCEHGLARVPLSAIPGAPSSLVTLAVRHERTPLGTLTLRVRADEGRGGDAVPRGATTCALGRVRPPASPALVPLALALLAWAGVLGRGRAAPRRARGCDTPGSV